MADYDVPANRLLPLHNMSAPDTGTPHAAIQSITMGIRVGDFQYAIGYIQSFSFDMKREAKAIWQIEPYPNVLGDKGSDQAGVKATYSVQKFDETTKYWPGEAIEVIPGKMGPLELKLNRYSVYTANLMAAMMRSSGAGVYNSTPTQPHIIEDIQASIDYVSLLQQVRPFDIYQIFVSPLTGAVLWGRKFGGCWFTTIGEKSGEAEKNDPIMEEASVQATYLRPLTSSIAVKPASA